MYTTALYCTSTLYTLSHTVSTNRSSVAEPYRPAHRLGVEGGGGDLRQERGEALACARVGALVEDAEVAQREHPRGGRHHIAAQRVEIEHLSELVLVHLFGEGARDIYIYIYICIYSFVRCSPPPTTITRADESAAGATKPPVR